MNPKTVPAQAAWVIAALTSGCATYRPLPIEPAQVLESLELIEWHPDHGALGPQELSAFAISHNPQLAAVRAELGYRRALLVEAGLLPDPEAGWDAMSVLAPQLAGGASTSADALSGLTLMFPLLRPGEREARTGIAEWGSEEASLLVTSAEWSLTRDVHVAYEEACAAELLFTQTQALVQFAAASRDHVEQARDAGAATAIQANHAIGEFQTARLQEIHAEDRVGQAREALNDLLGLPPSAELPLRSGEDPSASKQLHGKTSELVAHAVHSRPDLAAQLALYKVAEEELRLAVSQQSPLIAIGTGISITLPIFSKLGRPGIQSALAKREQLNREFTAAVHTTRQEIAAAHRLWKRSSQELKHIEELLLANIEHSLELSEEAHEAGEVTLLEVLLLRRAVVEVKLQQLEAQAEHSKLAWKLLAASGWLLGRSPVPTNEN